ncbi:MAG: hypothetical protein HFH84_12120 [Lachnospiraceae bacterium]|nr:hypothetical protein [Lachnospiraceae bacterium]
MEQKTEDRQQVIREYKEMLDPLLRYLPWLEGNAGKAASRSYQGQGISKSSMSFPVYDATLLNFIREASNSALMDRNYSYVYTRNRIRTHDDERRVIAGAQLRDWDILRGILSRYVLEGRTKATLWGEAVQENIFLLVLQQMRKVVEYWDRTKR